MKFGSSLVLVAALAVAASPLAGCESFNRAIGKERVIPNEFDVVTNAPLAIPPNFALRPPRVGTSPLEASTTAMAQETVFRAGDPKQSDLADPKDGTLTKGEKDLLEAAGAENAAPDIRQTVDADPTTGIPFERSLVDKLIFWSGPTTPPSNQVINPAQEESRLRLAEAAAHPQPGAAAPGGAPTLAANPTAAGVGTPTFERTTKSGWLSWLF